MSEPIYNTRPVAICQPTLDHVIGTNSYDLGRLMRHWAETQPNTPTKLFQIQGTYLHQQREDLIELALKADASHVLFLDSDMRFPPTTLHRLLQRGKGVVGANYATRRPPIIPTAVKDGRPYYTLAGPDEPDLIEVDHLGMGVMLIDAAILRRIEMPRFRGGWNPQTKQHGGEDISFANRVREIGESIWCDNQLTTEVAHTGQIEYTMDDAVSYAMVESEKAKAQAAA